MPLDHRLALMAKTPQIISPNEARAEGIQIRGLQRGEQEANREIAERQQIRDLYKQFSTDGQVDNAGFEGGIAQAGLGDKLPDIQKNRLSNEKLGADTGATKFKLAKDRADAMSAGLGSLMTLPEITQQDVIGTLNQLVQQGIISPEQGAQMARTIPGQPGAIRPFILGQTMKAADASKRLEAMLPKADEQDRGGTINEGTIDPLTGQRTEGRTIQKTASPDAQLNAQTMREMGPVTYQQTPTGIVAVPTRPGAGPIQSQSVLGPDGQPLQGKDKSMTEGQSKALLFGTRMREADKIMQEVAGRGENLPSVTKQVAESVPGIGGALGAAANAGFASPDEQRLEQSQRDFVNAVLRRESGATIQDQEFQNAKKQYFPQIGDGPEVIAQKARNRALAITAMLHEVPENKRTSLDQEIQNSAPSGARPPLDAFFKGRK